MFYKRSNLKTATFPQRGLKWSKGIADLNCTCGCESCFVFCEQTNKWKELKSNIQRSFFSVLPSTQHNRNCTRCLFFLQKPSVTTVWINTAITQQKSFSLRLDWVKMWIIWIRHWDLQKGYCPDMCVDIMTTSTPPKNTLNTIFFSKYLQSLPFIDHKSLDDMNTMHPACLWSCITRWCSENKKKFSAVNVGSKAHLCRIVQECVM